MTARCYLAEISQAFRSSDDFFRLTGFDFLVALGIGVRDQLHCLLNRLIALAGLPA